MAEHYPAECASPAPLGGAMLVDCCPRGMGRARVRDYRIEGALSHARATRSGLWCLPPEKPDNDGTAEPKLKAGQGFILIGTDVPQAGYPPPRRPAGGIHDGMCNRDGMEDRRRGPS